MLFQINSKVPVVQKNVYIAPSAIIIGDVRIGDNVGIWFQAVIRGDEEPIVIGNNTNIQDGSVLHTDYGYKLVIGNNVTVGHKAMLHGCVISDNCLIGMNSVIMNGSKIGKNCIIGANALIGQGKEIPDNSLVVGSPARRIREVTSEDLQLIAKAADSYVKRIEQYRELRAVGA